MDNNLKTQIKVLTYLGILPFAMCTALLFSNYAQINPTKWMIGYSAIIASFISGSHWGIYSSKSIRINLLIHSNIIALLAWLSLLIPTHFAVITLIFCFLYLITLDYIMLQDKIIPNWYFKIRISATTIVILLLVLFLIVSIVLY